MQSHLQQRRSPSCRQTARARPSPHSPPPATRSPRSRCSAPAGSVTTARAAHRGRARLRAVVHLEEHAAARRDCPACSRRCASACLRPPPCSGAGDGLNSPATPARANLAGKHGDTRWRWPSRRRVVAQSEMQQLASTAQRPRRKRDSVAAIPSACGCPSGLCNPVARLGYRC
ncbi:hypothetical protein PVAP13_5KG615507 [Panicum virgatum]|uniref:Uncharacterized protein n=1 Tax=Panicum virgatum TaxID=38727 RepID=A0A8T0SWR9_PANVG|nr:hypothetical protein PVAP13_5KG615507 [Panicum virgatum]